MDKKHYTPMIQQYLTLKEAHEDAILFFRLGDFYEMFFSDAILASKLLEIQLTARDGGSKDRIPMCGVPHHSAEGYIKRLVDQGYKVAIGEQVEEADGTKKLVDRQVVRLITPGTNIDDERATDVFIAALAESEHFYALATLNLSTGQAQALKVVKDDALLMSEMTTLQIKEVITAPTFHQKTLTQLWVQHHVTHSRHELGELEPFFKPLFDALPSPFEQKNAQRLIDYIKVTQKRTLLHLKPFELVKTRHVMRLDANTIRHLELLKTMRQNQEHGSLAWLLKRTQTALGFRFLKQQLLRPLLDSDRLNGRYEAVGELNNEFITKDTLIEALKGVYDLERLVGRLSYGNATPRDLGQLSRSLTAIPPLKEALSTLKSPLFQELNEAIDPLQKLSETLERALVEELPLTLKDGGVFKEGFDEALDVLKRDALGAADWLDALEQEERERTGIKKLKVGYNRVFGYYLEVPKGQMNQIKDDFGYHRKQTLANAERYITPALKEKEKGILEAAEASIKRELELFTNLSEEAKAATARLQKNAQAIAQVDFLVALSLVSESYQWTRPVLHTRPFIHIVEAVHPVVSALQSQTSFIANDIVMDEDTDILLITGPNMSGKSTYMRQLALIVILAQIGSFVPAKEAHLPLFDQVFTRIGASDDLSSGQSTFMVEMLEADYALSQATPQSLILFDEIGRGTSTYDGLALAWAMLEHMHDRIGAKTLFSTHYHELVALEHKLPKLHNVHVSATEKEGHIHFHHQVKPGPSDRSYGIHVAALAGLPKRLIARANQLLHTFEASQKAPTQPTLFDAVSWQDQQEDTPPQPHWLDTALEQLDLDGLSPLEALNTLYEWRKKSKEKS